jgi:hypothetical protein
LFQSSSSNPILPTTSDQEKSNGSFVITKDFLIANEDIEMRLMNSNSITPLTLPTCQNLHKPPPDCCPKIISKYFSCCAKFIPERIRQRWTFFRSKAHRLVEHRFFEWIIIASILASSTTLVS